MIFLWSNSIDKRTEKMGGKSPGPSLEVHRAGMAEVFKGVSGAGVNS